MTEADNARQAGTTAAQTLAEAAAPEVAPEAAHEAGAGAPGEVARLQAELTAARAERDEMKDRFMRTLADAENARKRSERDRREAEQYGGSRLARDLLPVFDAMKRALEAVKPEDREAHAALLHGIELTQRELLNVFRRHGIELVSPAIGDPFDPQRHEAMFEAPVPGTSAGEILQVMVDGFTHHDRLLRPAQVGVSSTPKG